MIIILAYKNHTYNNFLLKYVILSIAKLLKMANSYFLVIEYFITKLHKNFHNFISFL
jgi:hypothetical protein